MVERRADREEAQRFNMQEEAERRARIEAAGRERRAALAAAADVGDGPMTKPYVSRCLGEALREVRGRRAVTVVSELGAPYDFLGLAEHGAWRQEPHSGGLGWGLPCAMGMQLADPERLVVATMGDGSYLFANPVAAHHVGEVHGIAMLTVILNNAGYGAVQHAVTGMYPTGYAAKADVVPLTGLSPSPDFRLVAESCRAWAESVSVAADLPDALRRAFDAVAHGRQAVLDVHIA